MLSRAKPLLAGVAAAALAASIMAMPAAGLAQTGGGRGSIIESETLAPLNPWNASGLARGERGLARGLWGTSDSSAVGVALDAVPANISSPAAMTWLRAILASPADPPTGDSRTAARKRIEVLARLGAADEVLALSSGALRDDPATIIFAVQAELASGRMKEACGRLGGIVIEEPPPFVLRMRAVCLAVDGQPDAAALALEVATARNAGDPWLTAALRQISNQAPAAPSASSRAPATAAKYDTSINAAVSIAAGLTPPRDTGVTSASLFAARALAFGAAAPATARAEAAIRLVRLERMDPAAARLLLDAAVDPTVRTPMRWIALARDVQAARDATAQAAVLRTAIDQAGPAADASAIHRLFRAELTALSADPAVLVGATSFARAALAAGDTRVAQAWRAKADRTRSDARMIAVFDAALGLWSGGNGDSLRYAAERVAEAGGPSARRDVTALAAMGAPIQGAAERLLAAPVSAPTPPRAPASAAATAQAARLATVLDAVQRRAVGETGLNAAVLVADGAQRLDAATLDQTLRALTAVGLGDFAADVALEAMLSVTPAAAATTTPARPAPAPPPRKQ